MRSIFAPQAPRPIGPYSQAIVSSGNLVFCSGQIGLNPATGNLVENDIASQTRQVMENLKAVLSQANTDFDHVLKTTAYLTDLSNFTAFNDIYSKYFSTNFPARSTIQASALPKNALVEIDLIAEVVK